jgi:transcriptional regulator with XRE-family HTH domain
MSDVRLGSVFRAVRRRFGWRQRDVAERAGVHQQTVSLIERGRLELVGIRRLRRVAKELEIDVDFVPRWRGASVDRLVDAVHSVIVDAVVVRLRARGFEVLVEWSFNHFGERGAIDVVGWRAETRTLVIVEIKSTIATMHTTLSSLDRYVRIASKLLPRERGWQPAQIGRILALPETTTSRDALRRNQAILGAVLPARTREITAWLRSPSTSIAGVWLLRVEKSTAGCRIRRF